MSRSDRIIQRHFGMHLRVLLPRRGVVLLAQGNALGDGDGRSLFPSRYQLPAQRAKYSPRGGETVGPLG
jgi:hypothetical protein